MDVTKLGQRIRELRMKKGMTQVELGEGLITASMVSQIESGKARPSHEVLIALAERLDSSWETLVAEIDLQLTNHGKYKLARTLMVCKDYAIAIELLEELIREPDSRTPLSEVKCDLAECLVEAKQYDRAYPLLHSVLEEAMDSKNNYLLAEILKSLGQIEFDLQRYTFALRHWKRAVDAIERSPVRNRLLMIPLLLNMGSCYQQLNQLDEGLACFQRATSLSQASTSMKTVADLYLYLTVAYRNVGEHWRAAMYAERAAGIQTGLHLVSLGESLRTKYDADAERRLEEEIEKAIDSVQALEQEDRYEEAGALYLQLAKLYEQADEYESAAQVCESADRLLPPAHPKRAELYRIWGWAAHRDGDWERTDRLWRLASEYEEKHGGEPDGTDERSTVE